MDYLGSHYDRETYYFDLNLDKIETLPDSNWICFMIANEQIETDQEKRLRDFLRFSIDRDLLEFIGQGHFGGFLHLSIDEIITDLEINHNHPEVELTTTGDNDTNFDNGFWECFGATALPDRADYDNLKIICVTLDNTNYKVNLRQLIDRFNEGYLPEND